MPYKSLMQQLAGRVKHGDHLCVISDDPEQRTGAAAQYLADGLRSGEVAMYAAAPEVTAQIAAKLEEMGLDVAREKARGALLLPTADEAYLRDGRFDADVMYAEFERVIADAQAAGFTGCRFAGEPTWALHREDLRPGLVAFEARLNRLLHGKKAAGFCVYDRSQWPASVLREVLRSHPVAVIGDLVCENNLYFEPPERAEDEASAERQVERMLQQLRDLQTQETRLQIALEAGRLGNWELELASDHATRSRRHDQIFGYEEGAPVWGFAVFIQHVVPEDRARVEATFRRAIEQRSTWHFECRIKRASDGAVRWIEAHGRPITEPSGRRVGRLLGIVADVTERKELEETLREQDRKKDEFLATLAHELRNPLAPISNAVQVLRLEASPDPRTKWAREVIERQLSHMVRLVDDLLDVSRITTGRIEIQRERLELKSVLASAIEASQPLLDAARHHFSAHLPEEPLHVSGDATRLAQVFLNLLNNAARYTPDGGHIRLVVERTEAEVVVRVEDDGIGIDPELKPQLFDIFVQGRQTAARVHAGLGIGLSLTRTLLELHGGSIEAHSAGRGQGSQFVVRLPLASAAVPTAASPSSPLLASTTPPRRVLVVDDNVDAAESLAETLRILEITVETAHDGRGALRAASAFGPDVIILDIGLPDLDGYEVARRLRETMGREVRLIALTGWGQERDRQRAREAGFDEHWTKPVELTALLNALGAALPAA